MQKPQALGHIVHCADYGGPYPGSFVPMMAAAARAGRRCGCETTICFSEASRERPWLHELEGLADIRFIERTGTWGVMRQLREILDDTSGLPLIVHTHFGTFDVPAALLRLQRRQIAVLWHLHSERNRRIRLRSKAYGTVFGHVVDAVVCVSRQMQQGDAARLFPSGKLRFLPNAIDLARFGPITPEQRAVARQHLGLSPDAHVVLHFAWDWGIKGGDRLLATADLMATDDGIEFLTVVGENDGAAHGERLKRHPTVRPLAPRGNVNGLYAAADVFLNCSVAEGFPYAVLEALARGLPVVATNPPVQRDTVDGLPGGFVVSPAPTDISSALRRALALTPRERADHAAAARDRVSSSYALDAWSDRLTTLYTEALNGKGQPP